MNSKLFGIIFVLCFVGTFGRSYKFLIQNKSSSQNISQAGAFKSSVFNRLKRSIESLIVDTNVKPSLSALKQSQSTFLASRSTKPVQFSKPNRTTRPTKPSRSPRILKASSTTTV